MKEKKRKLKSMRMKGIQYTVKKKDYINACFKVRKGHSLLCGERIS